MEACLAYRLSSSEIESATRVQILDEIACVSFHVHDLGNGMNPYVLPQVMGK